MTDTTEDIRRRFAEAETIAPGDVPSPVSNGDAGEAPRAPSYTPDDHFAPDDPGPRPDDEPADLHDAPSGDWEPDYGHHGGGHRDSDHDRGDGPEVEGATYPQNDVGNGRRFALYYGDYALNVPRVGWHAWDNRRWKLDPDGLTVRRLAQGIQDRIVEEIPHLSLEPWELSAIAEEQFAKATFRALDAIEEKDRTAEQEIQLEEARNKLQWISRLKDRRSKMKTDHRTFAKSTGNRAKIDAMLTEATTSLSHDVAELDSDPLTVNTESGLLQFAVEGGNGTGMSRTASMNLRDHARAVPIEGGGVQIITKLIPAPYDPAATCPRFDAFLARVQPDPDMRAFLQRWWGLSMTALPIQKFVFQYGKGANGKSVLSDLMNRLLGDYATTIKIKSLTGRNNKSGADATPDLMPLVGARAALATEPEEGDRLQEGMIKDFTGGEKILVRQLHADFIEIRPYFKLTISGNHKPDIRGTDDGIWRRVLLVPFDVQIPPDERDEKLIDKLWDERAGILNWLVTGLIDYLEGGLQEPAQVLDATQEYRADSDPIGSFLADACSVTGSPDDFLTARELIDGFNLWLDQRGETMWGGRTVSLKFKGEAGRYTDPSTGKAYQPGKRDVTGYRGIRFTAAFRDQYDRAPRDSQGRPRAYSNSSGPDRSDTDVPL